MDRRDFFKTFLSTSLLVPLALSSKSKEVDSELYLISDSPQLFMPSLLKGLQKTGLDFAKSFSFDNSYPWTEDLKRTLSRMGLAHIQKKSPADVCFSSIPLHRPTRPSFTLIKDGQVCDLRSKNLFPLWKEISTSLPATQMTRASFKRNPGSISRGSSALILVEGKRRARISLQKNGFFFFVTKLGKVGVAVEEGKAFVHHSSCSQKVCVHTPPVSLVGDRIICAPNRFVLEIDGPHFLDTILG